MAGKDFFAGSVYVQVLPTLDGWTKDLSGQLEDALKDVRARVSVTPVADAQDFQRNLDDELSKASGTVHIEAEVEANEAEAARAGAKNAGAFADAFKARVRAALQALPEIEVDADTSEADREIAAIRAELSALQDKRIDIDIDAEGLLAQAAILQQRLEQLERTTPTVRARADVSQAIEQLESLRVQAAATGDAAEATIERVRTNLSSIVDRRIMLEVSAGQAQAEIELIREQLDDITRNTKSVRLRADTEQLLAKLVAVQGELREVARQEAEAARTIERSQTETSRAIERAEADGERAIERLRVALDRLREQRIQLKISDAEAHAQIDLLKAELAHLGASSVSTKVRADVSDFMAKMLLVEAELAHIDGTVDINADDHGSIDLSTTRMQKLILAVTASSGAIGGLGAAFLALGAGAVVGAAGVLAIGIGLKDIGAAMKAQTAATRQAGQSAAQEAAQQVSAANQVLNARDSLRDSIRGVADAQRSASDNIRSSLIAQTRAEEQLQAAQVSALRAQQALTDARNNAKRSIEDLKNQVIDDGLAERDAVLQVKRAQDELNKTLADPLATERQREEAQLTFEQATQRLSEISLSYQRSQDDATAAAAAGVDGSKQVVAAQDSVVSSQRQLRDSQVSAQEAARKADEARVLGAEQVTRAQEGVIRAQRALEQAQAAQVVQATRQGEAHVKFQETLEKLTPASFQFISTLRSQSGEWLALHQASQAFVPGLQRAFQGMQPLYAQLNQNVETISASTGAFFEVLGDGLRRSGPFWDQVAAASTDLFPRFGESVNRAAGAVGELVLEMLPLTGLALDTVDALSGMVSTLAPFIAQASGPLLSSLRDVITEVGTLGPLLVDLATFAAGLTSALVEGLGGGLRATQPGLHDLLQALLDLVQAVSPLLVVAGQLASFLAESLAPVLHLTADVLGPVVKIASGLVDVITSLPAPLVAMAAAMGLVALAGGPLRALFTALSAWTGTLATNMGTLSTRMSGPTATAMGATAAGTGRLSTAFSKLGSALPVIGIALAGLGIVLEQNAQQHREDAENVDKLAAALVRGGTAAADATEAIKAYRTIAAVSLPEDADRWNKLANDATVAYQRQLRSMTDVELAQGRTRQAQLDYNEAVRKYGEDSAPALALLDLYRDKLGTLKHAQELAAAATKTHTERLQDQQDLLLGLVDAQAGFERAGIRVKKANSDYHKTIDDGAEKSKTLAKAQTEYNTAVAKNGPNSKKAKEALDKLSAAQTESDDAVTATKEAYLDLNSAQSTYVSSAAAAAIANEKAKGGSDEAGAAVRGHNDALLELFRTQGVDLPPAMLSMIAQIGLGKDAWGGLQSKVDDTGQTILNLPGGPNQPPVEIKFHDNMDTVKNHVDELQVRLSDFQQWFQGLLVGPGTGPTSLAQLLGLVPAAVSAPGSPLQPSGGTGGRGGASARDLPGVLGGLLGRASGGMVPGSGSGDTVLSLLTPGEFVFSEPAVQRLGPANLLALHAAARYASGGLVGPLRLATGGAVGGVAGGGDAAVGLDGLSALADSFVDITDTARPLVTALDEHVVPALRLTQVRSGDLASTAGQDWTNITADVRDATTLITGTYVVAMLAGLSQVDTAVANTATGFATRWAAIRGYAADPVRYALTYPFNQGLILAWNVIDQAFAVGKPLAPIPIGFAAGGSVFGGTRGKDSVPAYLMPGEYVLPVPMVNQIGVGNLEHARRSVLRGGSVEGLVPGFEAGGAVTKALAFATAQVGKPYIWGGVGPAGYDCSGLASAVSNVALGLNPYQRRFSTEDFAPGRGAGGFLPGRGSSLVIGVSDAHMAGTLAGHNFESTTKNGISGVRVDGDASSALDGQFTKGQFYLPQAGGVFIPGPTGGAAFDLAGLLDSTFAATRDAIASIIPAFGANTIAAGATAELTAMLAAATAWAKVNLAVTTGAPGSGPVADQVRGVAARFGWGEGPQWDALSTLIAHESSWNPGAQNPISTAFGLFQLLDGTWPGTGIAKSDNPALQAEAGLRYIQQRYGDPANAWRFWESHHWYDQGGYLPPGLSLAYNGTGRPEPVLSGSQWQNLAGQRGGGAFTGTLQLDSGEFLGVVRGEIEQANTDTGRAIAFRPRL